MAFEIAVGERGGRAVAGAGDVDDVERILFDEAIEVDPDEGLAGVGAPVAEQAVLDVLGLEGFAEERIVAEEDHAAGEVVAREPVGVHAAKLVGSEDRGRGRES